MSVKSATIEQNASVPERAEHRRIEEMIPRYLEGSLSEGELSDFLQHMNHCRSCYEELETMYMLDRTLRYLDEDADSSSLQFAQQLRREMQRSRRELRFARIWRRVMRLVMVIAIALALLALLDFTGILPISRYLF